MRFRKAFDAAREIGIDAQAFQFELLFEKGRQDDRRQDFGLPTV